jgi:hypothetical protein
MTATEQLTLDLRPLARPLYTPGMTLDERFAAFHEANPHVADALESLAAQWLSRHRKVGVKSLGESLRWTSGLQVEGDPYRITNSYLSRYARLLIERHPEWADAIETRSLAAERAA